MNKTNRPSHKLSKKAIALIIVGAILLVTAIILAVIFGVRNAKMNKNGIILSDNFDTGEVSWDTSSYYAGKSNFSWDATGGKDGSGALKVETIDDDARFIKTIEVRPNSYYKFSVSIRTEGLELAAGTGANLSVLGVSNLPIGDVRESDWQDYVWYGKTLSDQNEITICLRLGFYGGTVTGTAWFDDLTIEKVSNVPTGASFDTLEISIGGNKSNVTLTTTQQEWVNKYDDTMIIGLAIAVVALCVFFIAYRYAKKDKAFEKGDDGYAPEHVTLSPLTSVLIIVGIGLILRLVISLTAPQCSVDMNLFKYWGNRVREDGIFNVYKNAETYNIDYPPLYMYFLGFNSLIVNAFGLSNSTLSNLIFKLPSILADVGIGLLIYRFGKRANLENKWTLFAVCAWMFNPCVILDSSAWGQVESLQMLFSLLMMYFLIEKKYIPSAIALGLAIILKPQGIFLVPLIGFAIVRDFFGAKTGKERINLLKITGISVLSCIATIVLIALPFGACMEGGIFKWLINLYVGTVGGYKGATVNSYNFYYILGFNWKDDSTIWNGMSLFTWGMFFIVISCFAAWFIFEHYDGEDRAMPLSVGASMIYLVTMFGPRMHERYFFPVLGLLLAAALLSKDKIMWILYGFISGVNFMSVLSILMGLEVGGGLNQAGADYEVYGEYYWAGIAPHRMAIAILNLALCLALFMYVMYKYSVRDIKIKKRIKVKKVD